MRWVRIRRAERVELARKRQASVYSPKAKFPFSSSSAVSCGDLVRRSEIPVQNPDGLDVLGIFLHVPPRRIKRGTRLGTNRLTSGEKYGIIISLKIQNLTEGKNAK